MSESVVVAGRGNEIVRVRLQTGMDGCSATERYMSLAEWEQTRTARPARLRLVPPAEAPDK